MIMNWRQWLPRWWLRRRREVATEPEHLRRGRIGEAAAKASLEEAGLKFLVANFRDPRAGRGEIDLVFRDGDCLAFVEVKTRSRNDWVRPADAVDAKKRLLLSKTAMAYLRRLKTREVKWRFDIVEVLLQDGEVREVRHLPNAFPGDERYRFI